MKKKRIWNKWGNECLYVKNEFGLLFYFIIKLVEDVFYF